jgi:uncharacterized protein (TIGR04255 family)
MTTPANRRQLSKAPLSLALCQIKFSPIRTMASYVPQVQDAQRKDGYRLDLSGKVQEVTFGPQGAQAQVFDRWEFLNVAKTRSVVITEQFAAYQTSEYATFDEFLPKVLHLMDALTKAGADVLITRVGLRHVHAIVPSAGKTWRDYLVPSLHGTQSPVLSHAMMAHHVFGSTASGRMLARISQNTEGLLVPVELAQQNLTPVREPPAAETTVTLIDIDHFKEWTEHFTDYEPEALHRLVRKLRNDIYTVFCSFVTEAAIKEWS